MKTKQFVKKAGIISLASFMSLSVLNLDYVTRVVAAEQSVVNEIGGYKVLGGVKEAKASGNEVLITYTTGEKAKVRFLEGNIFRFHMVPEGADFQETPDPIDKEHKATPVEKLDEEGDYSNPDATVEFDEVNKVYKISNKSEGDAVTLEINAESSLMKLLNADGKTVWEEAEALKYKSSGETIQTLKEDENEYFYGGGTQNGAFSHRGKKIKIENTNNWVDGGVASPNPFYWSTNGYGVMRNTFQMGTYDFGKTEAGKVATMHKEARFDAYYFVDETPVEILGDYYDVTGKPQELPDYANYLGHLNCYNRDYWVETEPSETALKIGDKYYEERDGSGGNPGEGVIETLNDEGNPVNAWTLIELYQQHDIPIGWFAPNDGYGCGYGQESTQDGNLANLKTFTDHATANGLYTGLWTQANLWPADPENPLKDERDVQKEVEAGVSAVKTDVAWVGDGYSFGLNGLSVAHEALQKKTAQHNSQKPNIVSLDGWAGTQRYGGIWTGDQTGGQWEYIRFMIPTYIGTGLSGQPNVGSDLDGIFGGGNKIINARDYQWKAFSTFMLAMDGWGNEPKLAWQMGTDNESINRI